VCHLNNVWLASYAEFFKNRQKFLVSNVSCRDAGIAMPYKRTKTYEKRCCITFGTEGVVRSLYTDQYEYSLCPIMIAPPRFLLRTYSGILPKRHGILVECNT
jgi:hypothetical protein